MKRRNLIFLTAVLTLIAAAWLSTPVQAATEDSYTLQITGDFNYASGQEMINYINTERESVGVGSLELDSELTDAAMQRAAEIVYSFSHTRPDGTSCQTVHNRVWGENIAGGGTTASATYEQWKNSPGHYANMIKENYTKIGIGHFKHCGVDFWVQLFGTDSKEYPETRRNTVTTTTSIEITETTTPLLLCNGNLESGDPLKLAKEDDYQLRVSAVNSEWTYAICVFNCDSFTWTSSDESIVTVDENGLIEGVDYGTATITGTVKTGTLEPFTITVSVGTETDDPSCLVGKTTVTVNTWDKTEYDSVWDMLENEVTVSYNGSLLVFEEDYYFSQIIGDGSGSLSQFTITYIKKYTGEEVHYSLASQRIYSIPDYEYTGEPITPSVTVSGNATEGKDYTIAYSNNIEVGTATVTVTGIGCYHGTLIKTFNIIGKPLTGITAANYTGTYDGEPHTICVTGVPETAEVTYSTTQNGTYSEKLPTRTNAGTTTVYYKVEKENYTTFTGSAKIVINPSSALVGKTAVQINTWDINEYTSINDMLKNEVAVTYNGNTLAYNEDYCFSDTSAVNGSLTQFTITYCGNYTGKETHYSMASQVISSIPDYEYTGSPITPSVIVSSNAAEGEDYTVTYSNNTKVGTAAVTITGIGNYHGTLTKTFNIIGKSFTGITASDYTGTYDGAPHTIHVNGVPKDAKITYSTTKNGTYSEELPTRTNAGTTTIYYKVTKTNYKTFTGSAKIVITPINAADYPVTLSGTKFAYSGSKQTPVVSVTDENGIALVNGADYSITYASGCTQVGRYSVTVKFINNYSGTKTLYFTIVPNAPSSVSAVLYGYNDVNFSWKSVSNASGYYVYYKKSTSSTYTYLTRTTSTSFKKANLPDGAKYYFKVIPYYYCSANNTKYTSLSYKTASVYTLKKLNTPKISKYKTYAKVSWNNISGESGYQIYKMTRSGGKYKLVKSYYYSASRSYANIPVTKNKTYYYKVRAYKTVNGKKIYGPWSNVKSFKRK